MNNTIRLKQRQRNRAHKKAKNSNNPNHWFKYRCLRNEVITLVRESKERYIASLSAQLSHTNLKPNKWWKIAKSIIKLNNETPTQPPLKYNNQIFTHPIDKAAILNQYFASISKITFVKDNNILSKYQSGFQANDSTVNQLLEIYNIIISNLDKGNEISFIFCDISKAFDKVSHQGLLIKLQNIGIGKTLCNWINNYLTNRKQSVILDGFKSTDLNIEAGVPQGSILGPFLFLIYINDISENLENHVRLFADDTTLFTIINNDPIGSAIH